MLNRTEQNLKARGDRDCFCSHGAHAVEQSIPPSAHGVGRAPDYYYRTWLKAIIQAVHVASTNQGTTALRELLETLSLQLPSRNP